MRSPGDMVMGGHSRKGKPSRVLIDVCTQRDYLDDGAILQVLNRKQVSDNLLDLFRWIKSNGIPVISIVESHRTSELNLGFPLHCIDGTPGQDKIPSTILPSRTIIETDNCLSLPLDLHERYQQLVFRKRTREILGNPKADRLLTQMEPDEFIICGIGLERSIKSLALGLLARHKPNITVIGDACGHWSEADGELSLRQLSAKGIKLVSTAELIVPPPTLATSPRAATRGARRRHHPEQTAKSRRRKAKATKR